ncbi:hypothetical protein [Streptacidiphilus jiangxiensis]|uniref:Uncharacterized protein n=1 Tax=Streptacidiphilus jiangxiensis TaxID=235985 RepID=A0A1H8BA07_STRJI|nr:hypothetical protein [Streptacidiphilus jiangxiensis]SEM79643.1 hypothetical protein SAMN05414137_1605 [Streptacidiphilus jiangxiensis]
MSGDIPLTFVFASCPPGQVAPLIQALDDLSYVSPWCGQHEDGTCLPLGEMTTDFEAYRDDLHEAFAALAGAAPGAAFAVVGGASEDGPGLLLLHHSTLGPYRQDVAPEDDRLSPLFSRAQLEEILSSASTPAELDYALGGPWVQEFASRPRGCQSHYTAAELEAQAGQLRWSVATGALAVHRRMRDSSGQLWATATWHTGGSVVLTGDDGLHRITDRTTDRASADAALAQRLKWLRRH